MPLGKRKQPIRRKQTIKRKMKRGAGLIDKMAATTLGNIGAAMTGYNAFRGCKNIVSNDLCKQREDCAWIDGWEKCVNRNEQIDCTLMDKLGCDRSNVGCAWDNKTNACGNKPIPPAKGGAKRKRVIKNRMVKRRKLN